MLCYKGKGTEQNYKEALKWWQKAAEHGSGIAMFCLGAACHEGRGTNQNYEEAAEWWQRAHALLAQARSAEACLSVEQDIFREAMEWWRPAAESGDAVAQFNLGSIYDYFWIKRDLNEAVKWLMKAAEQGHAGAKYILGNMYILELGGSSGQDLVESMRQMLKSQQGDISDNQRVGLTLILESARQGYAPAQNSMGDACLNGSYGVEEDCSEAAKWYLEAAEQGDADAQYSLGKLYAEGSGVNQNFSEALQWWLKAASHGERSAMKALGNAYCKGQGTEKNYHEALRWYRAVFNNDGRHLKQIDELERLIAEEKNGKQVSQEPGQPQEQGKNAIGQKKNTGINPDKESDPDSGKTADKTPNTGANNTAVTGGAADAFCRMCGTKIPSGSGFCPKCGAPVNGSAAGTESGGMQGNYGGAGSPEAPGGMYSDIRHPLYSLKGWFAFRGRMGRREWWNRICIMIGISVGFVVPAVKNAEGFGLSGDDGTASFAAVLLIVMYIIYICFSVRRMHDMNLSGWCMLLLAVICVFIPVIPAAVWLGCVPGTKGPNRFGPDPVNNAKPARR